MSAPNRVQAHLILAELAIQFEIGAREGNPSQNLRSYKMGSYHLNNPNAAGESVTLAMAQPVGDAATAEAPAERAARRPGRPSRIGVFRRLDIEIDQTDCEKIEQMKSMLGVR